MSVRIRRRTLIAIPVVAVPLAVAAAVLVPMQALGAVDLPDKTPQQLVELATASDVEQFSGTIEQSSALGIPDLSGLTAGTDDADADGLVDLVTGSYTAKVFRDGDRARLQVLDTLAERNVFVDGDGAWLVDSESSSVTHLTFPDHAERPEPGAGRPTPEELLDRALAALDDTTEVTVGTDARVAGRSAYELVMNPRSDDTLVGEVRFAIDGETGFALAASITARGADDPAFSVGFTDVSFAAPDSAALAYEPGPDVTVTEEPLDLPAPGQGAAPDAAGSPRPTVVGEGWSAVVELATGTALPDDARQMLETVTTPVDGGRVLSTALLTVLVTDDGRVLAGAVPAERLVEVAAAGR